jgi:hypothetical protein
MVQQVVDTYGTPRYKEANPMVPSLVTFPFLFGVMFGDVGHGLLLFLFGLALLRMGEKVKKLGGEYGETFYDARYLLTAMGFFALYAGLLYNDFLSLALNLFESRYEEGPVNSRGVEMLPRFDVTNSGELDLSTTWPYMTEPPIEAPPAAFDGPYPSAALALALVFAVVRAALPTACSAVERSQCPLALDALTRSSSVSRSASGTSSPLPWELSIKRKEKKK